jgi:CheY-like chemotaxis protein
VREFWTILKENTDLVGVLPFRLIFMDCDMPVMDGIQATKILKEEMKNGKLPAMPIVACTAFASQYHLDKCLEAGMSDTLTKPINLSKLDKIIKIWLK